MNGGQLLPLASCDQRLIVSTGALVAGSTRRLTGAHTHEAGAARATGILMPPGIDLEKAAIGLLLRLSIDIHHGSRRPLAVVGSRAYAAVTVPESSAP